MQFEHLPYYDLLDFISHSKKMGGSIAYPPRLQTSGEAQGEPSSVPSCLGTNKLSDTAVDRLMLHLYSISTTGEESVVLCPNHNNKVSLNDGSLRASGQDYQFIQLSQQLQLLENLRFAFRCFTKSQSVIFFPLSAKYSTGPHYLKIL